MNLSQFTNRYSKIAVHQQPMMHSGTTFATNGHVLVIAETEKLYPALTDIDTDQHRITCIEGIIGKIITARPALKATIGYDNQTLTLPKSYGCFACQGTKFADKTQCKACDGDGECDNGEECQECDGTGVIYRYSQNYCPHCLGNGVIYHQKIMPVLDARINPSYLALFANEPNLKICTIETAIKVPVLVLHADTVKGIIMGIAS